MNWIIACIIWLKGVGIFRIPCILVFGIGWMVLAVAFLCSWLAIPVYACLLWLLRRLQTPYWPALILLLVLGPVSAVSAAFSFIQWFDNPLGDVGSSEALLFWGPLLCCSLAIFFSRSAIWCYFHPGQAVPAFSTE